MRNNLKRKLKDGKQTIGVWMTLHSLDVSEALSQLGFDWFVFDMEHSPLNIPMAQTLMQAMGQTETVPLVRVPWNNLVPIKRALDIGAYGVIIPWVNSKEEAINAVRSCKYPPEGVRGFGPRRPRTILDEKEYYKTANQEILVMVQIETQKAINNLDEILSVEGIDGFYIGPNDLAASLGFLGRPFETKVQTSIERILEIGKRAGVAPGIHGFNREDIKKRLKQGFQFVCAGIDIGYLIQGARDTLASLKKTGLL